MSQDSSIRLEVPLDTEVLRNNRDLLTKSVWDLNEGVTIYLDARRREWRKRLGLPAGTKVRWDCVRTVDVQELSCMLTPIRYRVTFGDGCWRDRKGRRHYFGVDKHLPGLDLRRKVTTTAMRTAVLLAILSCVGLRSLVWLLNEVFHLETSRSALDRWLTETSSKLPDAKGMAQQLHRDKPITEANLDEIFPKAWARGCVVVVRDEHGRIVATEEVAKRSTENIVAFLEKLKSWGLEFSAFYVDGCRAYRNAIREVFPKATIQYDYFHVIQNIWRHIWRTMVVHRKELRQRAKIDPNTKESKRLKLLAKMLWKRRGLLFKSEDRMTEEERQQLREMLAADLQATIVRRFIDKVWGIFRNSKDQEGANRRLKELGQRPEVQDGTGFAKSFKFLKGRFGDMITFLKVDGIRRNSLAETGMRCLRRLERGHDGFRSSAGRDKYLRLYQAIRYCGWSVHRKDGLLTLNELVPPAGQMAAA